MAVPSGSLLSIRRTSLAQDGGRRAWIGALAAVLFLAAPSAAVGAQAPAAAGPPPSMHAVRTRVPMVLDGRLDEPAWAEAAPATGFRQSDPIEGQPATETTEVRIVYDDAALYIGARMFDAAASKITRRLSKRDDTNPDADYLVVFVDPRHDHLTGAAFLVTAAGSLADGILYNDTWTDTSWDGVWDAKVSVDDRGWSAEIRIPFSQLRFPAGDRQTWGINFKRHIRRENETDFWELVLKKESGQVSRFGHLEGLDGIQPRPHLDLLPYATTRGEFITPSPGDPFNSGSRYFGNAGLDVKWGVGGSLTLDATVNPDFGQVEVDPAVVNLTAFETFYQEKRPFFTEGANIFSNFGTVGTNSTFGFNRANPDLFYSRRIGRAPQGSASGDFLDTPKSTTILGAAKLTGKTPSGWSVGVIEAVTGRESAQVDASGARSRVEVEPPTNYMVGRLTRDVGRRASAGLMFTGVARALGPPPPLRGPGAAGSPSLRDLLDTRAYGFGGDGHLFLDGKRDWVLHGMLAGSFVQGSPAAISRLQQNSARYFQRPDVSHVHLDTGRTSLAGWDGQLNLNKNSGDLTFNAALWGVSPGFEVNDIGFLATADRAGTHAVVLWKKPTPDRWTRSRWLVAAKFYTWNFNRDLQADGYYLQGGVTLKNYWDLQTSAIIMRPAWDDRLTRGGPAMRTPATAVHNASLSSDSRKRFGVTLTASHAYDTADGFNSSLGASLDIRPSPSLTISTGPQVTRDRAIAQYVRAVADPLAVATFGTRYVFSDLDQDQVSMTTRMDFIFTPKASLQVYMQPLLATGTYWNFKELALARTFDFLRYGRDGGTLAYDAAARSYTADPDGAGPAQAFTFSNPDFNFKSLRVNAIFRWEWRLGSTLYAVWTQQRQDLADPGDFALRRDLSSLVGARADNVFAVKIAYWLTR